MPPRLPRNEARCLCEPRGQERRPSAKTTRRILVLASGATVTSATVERVTRAGARARLTLPLDAGGLFHLLPEGGRVTAAVPGLRPGQ